jgi:hypothetical protein
MGLFGKGKDGAAAAEKDLAKAIALMITRREMASETHTALVT